MEGTKYGRYPKGKKRPVVKPVDELIKELKSPNLPSHDYREQSLRIHGLICARCGREFDYKNRHQLTVHHKDGNHLNNPRDGSNWENLCVYCHDEEHQVRYSGNSMDKDS